MNKSPKTNTPKYEQIYDNDITKSNTWHYFNNPGELKEAINLFLFKVLPGHITLEIMEKDFAIPLWNKIMEAGGPLND